MSWLRADGDRALERCVGGGERPQVTEAASICETQNRPLLAIATPCGRPAKLTVDAITPAGCVVFCSEPMPGRVAPVLLRPADRTRARERVAARAGIEWRYIYAA